MSDLHLNVKQIYFDEHKAGNKPYEFRLFNEYWKKKLIGRSYVKIFYKAGYPARDDAERIIVLPYNGYIVTTRTHPHFGSDPVKVFAIALYEAPTF